MKLLPERTIEYVVPAGEEQGEQEFRFVVSLLSSGQLGRFEANRRRFAKWMDERQADQQAQGDAMEAEERAHQDSIFWLGWSWLHIVSALRSCQQLVDGAWQMIEMPDEWCEIDSFIESIPPDLRVELLKQAVEVNPTFRIGIQEGSEQKKTYGVRRKNG